MIEWGSRNLDVGRPAAGVGTAASGGEAKYFLSVNGYSKSRPCPLVISLHGGGSGGFAKAKASAGSAIDEWTRTGLKGGCITIAPASRNHNSYSWNTLSNCEDLIDPIEETCERFNIDRKRIYITGQSMGGGGTSIYYLCFPELAAASCARRCLHARSVRHGRAGQADDGDPRRKGAVARCCPSLG